MSARPLAGRRVLVTRAAGQAGPMAARLDELGATALTVPLIEFTHPDDLTPLDDALRALSTWDAVIFSSVNGVQFTLRRMEQLGVRLAALGDASLYAVGPTTARALESRGLTVAGVAPRHLGESLAELVVSARGDRGVGRCLIPRAARARDVVPDAIRAAGGEAHVAAAYVTRMPSAAGPVLSAALEEGLDAALFTSGSTVEGFVAALGGTAIARRLARGVALGFIGPIAAGCARDLGLDPTFVADPHTADALLTALVAHFSA